MTTMNHHDARGPEETCTICRRWFRPDARVGVRHLAQFDRLRGILTGTHAEIPSLLAHERRISSELGLTESEELHQQLDDVVEQRQAAVRRRASAIEGILVLEEPLKAERASLEEQRRAYAVQAVEAFQARYTAAVVTLQGLWQESRILGAALKITVPVALPVTVTTSPVDGVARALPILADVPVAVDPAAAKLGEELDKVDGALSLIGAIKQTGELEGRHHRLSMSRGTANEHSGVFKVLMSFQCQTDGCEFQPGDLIDSTLIGGVA